MFLRRPVEPMLLRLVGIPYATAGYKARRPG